MADAAVSYLDIYLGPFHEHLARPDVTDIYVNKPGELWVETLGGAAQRVAAPEISEAQLWRLARQIAALTHQGISREHPLLAATLPDGSRIQIVAPPATRGPIALAIRKHVAADLSLTDYQASGAFATTLSGDCKDAADAELEHFHAAGDWANFLAAAVRSRKTIIVSGGTSTGKTTFLNALLKEIDPAERLILIEDTPELLLRQENGIGLIAVRGQMGAAQVTTNDLLAASLRLRPDRIVLGELRGAEAFTFLRAVNTGHPGSVTTIHADSPAHAIEQLALLVLGASAGLRREDIIGYIELAVDIFVQLDRTGGARRVAQVRWHSG